MERDNVAIMISDDEESDIVVERVLRRVRQPGDRRRLHDSCNMKDKLAKTLLKVFIRLQVLVGV